MDDTRLKHFREMLPVTETFAYLNHAAVAPLPREATRRMAAMAEDVSRSGDQHWADRNRETERVRGLAAQLLGARDPREVSFCENTSTGISMVAEGFADWKPGDNVVGACLEFPSNVYPWMRLADYGVEYRQAEERDGRIDDDEVLSLIDDRTRMVGLSWVQYASGYRCDLARIGQACRERGALFVVDVIQGLGGLALDVERDLVDVAVGSAHKWLLGPEGIGLLYVSDRVVDRLRPTRAGWRSMRDQLGWTDMRVDFAEGAKRFESGTLNAYGITALGASLEILLEAGAEEVERRVLDLTERAAAGLVEKDWQVISSRAAGETSGIVTAVHPGRDAEEAVRHLAQRGVVVAARAGRFRVSPHFYNTAEEIDRMLTKL
ncbi:MAG TPA: aminotransferase class V-fold PLP-dependent enzyme [Thermoanaerobaculia bacterium]|nr:aminotransferase class V-fold PLP-dependent enzyme [Thermoanaerobaculia bacterium]